MMLAETFPSHDELPLQSMCSSCQFSRRPSSGCQRDSLLFKSSVQSCEENMVSTFDSFGFSQGVDCDAAADVTDELTLTETPRIRQPDHSSIEHARNVARDPAPINIYSRARMMRNQTPNQVLSLDRGTSMVAGARSLLRVLAHRRRLVAGQNDEIEHTFSQDLPIHDEGAEMEWNNEDVASVASVSTRSPTIRSERGDTECGGDKWDDEWDKWNDDDDDDDDKGSDNTVDLDHFGSEISIGSDMAQAGSRISSTSSSHESVGDAVSMPDGAPSSPSRGFRSRRYASLS